MQEPDLKQRIISCYIIARDKLGDCMNEIVLDLNYFIINDVSCTDRTNIDVAFKLGALSSVTVGIDAIMIEIIRLCVVAKDMYIKGVFISSISDCIQKAEDLLAASEVWRTAKLAF